MNLADELRQMFETGLGHKTLREHGAVCRSGQTISLDVTGDEVCTGVPMDSLPSIILVDQEPDFVGRGRHTHHGGGAPHPHKGGHSGPTLDPRLWINAPLGLGSQPRFPGENPYDQAGIDFMAAQSAQAVQDFAAEADRLTIGLPDLAPGVAAAGYVNQARKLLRDAWDHYVSYTIVHPGSGDEVDFDDDNAAMAQKYAEASAYIDSFAAGASQLQGASERATGAVQQQNADYETSGQAAQDRADEARRINQAANDPAWFAPFRIFGQDLTGDTGGDTGVARQAGGRDPGYLGTAGKAYTPDTGPPKPPAEPTSPIVIGAGVGSGLGAFAGGALGGPRGIFGGLVGGGILGGLAGYFLERKSQESTVSGAIVRKVLA